MASVDTLEKESSKGGGQVESVTESDGDDTIVEQNVSWYY